MTQAEKWVRDEVGATYSVGSDYINVPVVALSELVKQRDHLLEVRKMVMQYIEADPQIRGECYRELMKACGVLQ
jgi:hypothetical protein